SSLGSLEHNLHGFAVPHFTDEDYFRSLTHGRAECMSEARRITVQLALVNRRTLVIMQELDGILNGDDVVILLSIDGVEQHRQRRRLTRARRARNENDSVP